MDYNVACDVINDISGGFAPEIVIVLGSGLAGFAEKVEPVSVIHYDLIPGFSVSTAPYHNGRLILGTLEGKRVACMDGRLHLYEGLELEQVVFPLRVLRKLGAERIILTNASGGINTSFSVGDIMLINDHINFQGRNPLIGKNDDEMGPRFPDMTYAYDPEFRILASKCAENLGIDIKNGVYLSCTGPSYETPAEIRAFRILGADAVGMSTVPEVIAAVHCGYKVLAFSLITNMAAGITGNRLTMEEVAETGKRRSLVLGSLVSEVIKNC
ncbi:MAG: purine-nucleoside phosphorylase [Clostridia bacterium]|nr:purine-nucleoside phosphorylase [Clostridia bacterium]